MASPIETRLGTTPKAGIKSPVVTSTTANITMSGHQTLNGVLTTDGVRVLVKDQTDGTENGVYLASTTAWSRASDWNNSNDVVNGQIILDENTGYFHKSTLAGPFVLGTTSVTFPTTVISSAHADNREYPTLAAALSDADIWTAGQTVVRLAERVATYGGGGTWDVITDINHAAATADGGYRIIATSVANVSLQLRISDIAKVTDFGAVGDGATNASTAVAAAVQSVADGLPVAIDIPPGTYDVVSFPGEGKRNIRWGFSGGSKITTSTFQMAHKALVEGAGIAEAIHLNGDTSEMGRVIDVRSRATSAASSSAYEKDGLFVVIQQDDDSSISHASGVAVPRDAVGIGARGYIGAGVSGRVWGLNAYAYVKETASGEATCIECNLMNTQTPVSTIGAQNQCVGLKITTTSSPGFVSGGNPTGASTAGTAAIHISYGSGDGWYKGVFAETADFVDTPSASFLELNGAFRVNRLGQVSIGTEDTDGKCLIKGNDADLHLTSRDVAGNSSWVNFQHEGVKNYSFGLDQDLGRMRLTNVDGVTATDAATAILDIAANGNIGVNGYSAGGGQGGLFVANASVVPTSNPTGGGILYVEGGALKFRGSSGTITTIAPA